MSQIYRRSGLIFCFVFCLLIVGLSAAMSRPPRNDVANTADALKYLEELDSYYSNIARPRLLRNDYKFEFEFGQPEIATAIQLLRLQTIDRIYSKHNRPRFGKRGLYQILRDRVQEDPDMNDWRNKFLAQR